MKMFYIKNLLAQEVNTVDPTKIQIPNLKLSKEEFKRIQSTINFSHYFITAFEGVNPHLRVTQTNPPIRLHAFIIDYDSNIDDTMINTYHTRIKGEYSPSWLCKTRGGGVRVIYEFEQPLLCQNEEIMKRFFRIVTNKLKLKKLFPGLDEAWTRSYEYWDIGIKWIELEKTKIPISTLNYWMYEASNLVDWDTGESFIPLIEIKKEIDRRYPGRWVGEFSEGARGVRFWDATADNPTAAVVRKNGIQCFTGNTPFLSWSRIFGEEFVERYKEQRIGKIITDIYYDGREYWRKTEDGWRSYDKADIKLYLKVQYNIKAEKEEGARNSELEQVINYINERNRIDFAVPLPMFKPGIVRLNSDKYLNIYKGQALTPDGDVKNWGDGFPFIAMFLEKFFISGLQLETFLGWLKLFYQGAFNFNPMPGQVLVIAGGVGVGKTFIANKIVGELVGGCVDGTSYLLGDTPFTATALSSPLILVDDAEPSENYQKYQKYSSMLKKLAANRTLVFNQKFVKACPIVWLGRVMVLCNTDVVSLGVIPALEASSQDKLLLLRAVEKYEDFALPSEEELVKTVRSELPKFASYLLNYEIPKWVYDESTRYKIKPIHDDELKMAAINNSIASSFFEMLVIWRREITSRCVTLNEWEGNSTELWTSMNEVEALKPLIAKITPQQIGKWMGILASRGFTCELKRVGEKRYWKIWWSEKGFPQEIQKMDYLKDLSTSS